MIRRTRKLKIDCCVNDGRPQGEGFPSFSYCVLYDASMDRCEFYDFSLKGNPFNEKPEFCRVKRITIEEEI